MSIDQIGIAEDASRLLLVGATLDNFRVHSLALDLNFLRLPKIGILPVSIWLCCTGQVSYSSYTPSNDTAQGADSDFFSTRTETLGYLFGLIGNQVIGIDIGSDGTLSLKFQNGELLVNGEQPDLDMIWTIASDSPQPYGDQKWVVTLSAQGELFTRRP